MRRGAKKGLQKIIAFVFFILLIRWVNATTYIGRDNNLTQYYICKDNDEVADLLGFDRETFDLSVYSMTARKTEKRTENINLYVVMVNIDDSFVVCFRGEEYDIFFYSYE